MTMPQAESHQPVQPFVLARLSDDVPQSVLRSLQTGIAIRHTVSLALVEPGDGGFRYLSPSYDETTGSALCAMLRATEQGRELCEACDFGMAREVFEKGPSAGAVWGECHMGLCGLAAPIVVADRVAAVLLCGQKAPPGRREAIRQRASALAGEIGSLDEEALFAAVERLDECTPESSASAWRVVSRHADEIGKLGQDRYDVERRCGRVPAERADDGFGRPCSDTQELRRARGRGERITFPP